MGKNKEKLEVLETDLSVSVSKKISDNNYGNNSVMLTHSKKVVGDITKKQMDEELSAMFEYLNDTAIEMGDVFNE